MPLCKSLEPRPTLYNPMEAACQAPLFMGFSKQEWCSGLPYPPPGDLPDPWIKSESLKSRALRGRFFTTAAAAAAAKALQSFPPLCDPMAGRPPGSPVPEILQGRKLEWVAISFSSAWKRKVKEKRLSRVRLLVTPRPAAHQAPVPGILQARALEWGATAFSVFTTRGTIYLVLPCCLWKSSHLTWILHAQVVNLIPSCPSVLYHFNY